MSNTPNIIRRFHAGEPQAFAEIIAEYKDDVFTLCARMLGDSVAENAAEWIFVDAHQAMHRLHPDTDVDKWILKRAVEYTLTATPNEVESSETTPTVLAQRILQELEPKFRVAVVLRDVLRLSEETIAHLLDLPLGTAKSRIHRGRLTLGRNFSPHLDQV